MTPTPGLLVCPACKIPLSHRQTGLACPTCSSVYPITEGIPCFAPSDPFYDAYAAEHCPYALSPKRVKGLILSLVPFWSWREWTFWRSAIPRCQRLLDFGCGRGREVFTERAKETVGFDASFQFIRDCAAHYDVVAQGTLPHFPFRDRSFDVIASSHVLGHIRHEQKQEVIAEIARLLRPGGVTAHIIETDSDHPIVRAAKRYPQAYANQFLAQDGHVGLEPARQVIRRFEAHGFRLETLRLVDAVAPSLQNFRKYLDAPEFADIPGVLWLRRLNRWTRTHTTINLAYEVGWGALHRSAEQWFGKPDHAQFIMVAFRLNTTGRRS